MKKLIKNANDFVLAVLMLALSLFLLLYPNITSNIPSVSMGGYFTRPDVYTTVARTPFVDTKILTA